VAAEPSPFPTLHAPRTDDAGDRSPVVTLRFDADQFADLVAAVAEAVTAGVYTGAQLGHKTTEPSLTGQSAARSRVPYSSGAPGPGEAADTGEHFMTQERNLTGRRFGARKVIRRLNDRDKWGRPYWLCRCLNCDKECKATRATLWMAHRAGKNAGCGCREHVATSKRHQNWNAGTLAVDYKKAARQFAAGEWWLAPREARRRLKVSPPTLKLWIENCPWRAGAGMRIHLLTDAQGKKVDFVAETDVAAVVSAKADCKPIPQVEGQVYFKDAMRELGCSVSILRNLMAAKNVEPAKVPGKSADGRSTRRSQVPRWFVDECKTERSALAVPADKITIAEAAPILGLSLPGVHVWIKKGHLKRYPTRILTAGGRVGKYPRVVPLLSRAEVAERASNPPASRLHRGTNGQYTANGYATTNGHAAPNGTPTTSKAAKPKGKRGRPSIQSMTTIEKRTRIREDLKSGKFTPAEIATRHHVSPGYIRNVRAGIY
jgi:hypothetical protein